MTNYNDGNWHFWKGGSHPISEKARGDITYADGIALHDVIMSDYVWDEPLMFRVTSENKEPREFWLADGEYYHSYDAACDYALNHDRIIHVREVLA